MTRRLLLYEDEGWPGLRPLTELLPVPALAFGDGTLTSRWLRAAGCPLLGIEARPDVLAAWDAAPRPDAPDASGADEVLAVNGAALPGPWLERALAAKPPLRLVAAGRTAGARLPHATLLPGLGRGTGLGEFLAGLELPVVEVDCRFISRPWHLIEWNLEALAADLDRSGDGIRGDVHPQAVVLEAGAVTVEEGARVDPLAVLDARGGPIRIERGAVVLAHTVVIGPCRVGSGTHLLGGFVGRSSIGPECRIAGEVEESIWQGNANKRHHGFVGHSVVGEWVNLGALTTTSDLKNNYGTVRVWVNRERIDSGTSKLGSIIGPHVKTGIGTLLSTGATVGTGSNLFGGGRFAPSHLPPFAWWDGVELVEHRIDPFLSTARIAMSRRGKRLGEGAESALRRLFERTAEERRAAGVPP